MRISDWSSDVCSSDLLEPAEPVAGRLRAAHGIEGIAPDAAAEGTRRALESKHFGDGGAVVGKAVDAGETRAEHLTLQPAPFGVEEVCQHAAVAVATPATEAEVEHASERDLLELALGFPGQRPGLEAGRSEEHTSELQSLM